MRIHLLGTGTAEGIPNPLCSCATCAGALQSGEVRGQTAALIDDVLLIDCGPEVPRSASRHGVSLARLRHLLLTHLHPDHAGPIAAMLRSRAGGSEKLALLGSPDVVGVLRDRVGPDDAVRLVAVSPGQTVQLDGYEVRVLAGGHGHPVTGPRLLFDVTGPDGDRLLYATDAGALPAQTVAAVADRAFDVILLEETFGDFVGHRTDYLDLTTFPAALTGLADVGALTPETDVVAVHLGHHNPPTDQLAARLRTWGARVVPDGTVLGTPASNGPARRRTLVLGGARSGKSLYAEGLVTGAGAVTYVATGQERPDDPEWMERVQQHRARRPTHWATWETTDLVGVLDQAGPCDVLLVDCLSLWLAAALDAAGTWTAADAGARRQAESLLNAQVDALLRAFSQTAGTVVAVSNEVGSGVVPASGSGRLYRDALGRLNAAVAQASTDVVLVVAGLPLVLKRERSEQSR